MTGIELKQAIRLIYQRNKGYKSSSVLKNPLLLENKSENKRPSKYADPEQS